MEQIFAKRFENISQINAPTYNEKYEVFVVRVKTNNRWKAVWRSGEEESKLVHERLTLLREKQMSESDKKPSPVAPKVVEVKKTEESKSNDPKYSFNKKADTKVENKVTSTNPSKKVVAEKK